MMTTISIHRVGGLVHWRVGPVGGSFYRARRSEAERARARSVRRIKTAALRRQARLYIEYQAAEWRRMEEEGGR